MVATPPQQIDTHAWKAQFRHLWQTAVEKYRAGQRGASTFFNAGESGFLASIGCTGQELYDFAEDMANYGEPTLETAMAIANVRREYFQIVEGGRATAKPPIAMSELPPKSDAVDGIEWLPRLIPKARAKLEGRLPSELMYGCGGDRGFFAKHGLDPAEFLQQVWKAQGNDRAVVDWVKKNRK
jgi:hypothetical protein